MTGPGVPGQYPPQHQHQYHPQHQYAQPHYAYPPQKPKRKLGLLIGVLVGVFVLALAGAGFWVFTAMDEPKGPPPVDASQDLLEAPIGCEIFDENEVKPHIPGKMDFEIGSANTNQSYLESSQCSWNNTDTFTKDKVRPAHVIATGYIYRATQTKSGVDAAKEHLTDRVRNGVPVNVKDAEEALLVAVESSDSSVSVTARFRNIVYHVDYTNQTDGANIKSVATELTSVAIGKVASKAG